MKNPIVRFVACLIIMLVSSPLLAINADDINKAIRDKGANWVASDTPISKLSSEETKSLFGLKPGSKLGLKPKSDRFYAEGVLPSHFDWRNVEGRNYVTSVKNQGNCGSCYAFSATAVLESRILITSHTPDTELDLSEQPMVSCDPNNLGCEGGYLDVTFDFLKTTGTTLETCYPYTSGESGIAGDCAGCADWQQNTFRVTSFEDVAASAQSIKSAIAQYGPVLTGFTVYEDFLYYQSGIYRHVTGPEKGGHAVAIVGYDDAQQCWIIKNSWGPGWGENGYFRIAAGTNECGIEDEVYTVNYAIVPGVSFVLSSSDIDFGMLLLPDQPFMTRTLTITNNGSVPLTDTSCTVTNPMYSVIPFFDLDIESAASADIDVMFTGQAGKTTDTAELQVDSAGITRSISLIGEANTRPDQPVNLQPPNGGAAITGQTVTLSASEFEDEDDDAHEASRWIIKDSSGSIVYSSPFDTSGKTAFTIPSGLLDSNTQYFWQVIYKDDRGAESQASSLTSFTTDSTVAESSSSGGGGNCFITTAAG
jgi:C1A family cysteine protease